MFLPAVSNQKRVKREEAHGTVPRIRKGKEGRNTHHV